MLLVAGTVDNAAIHLESFPSYFNNKGEPLFLATVLKDSVLLVSQARPFTTRRGEGKGLVKLRRYFCSHYAMKIMADRHGVTSLCPGSE